jgi:hypothetical protein
MDATTRLVFVFWRSRVLLLHFIYDDDYSGHLADKWLRRPDAVQKSSSRPPSAAARLDVSAADQSSIGP